MNKQDLVDIANQELVKSGLNNFAALGFPDDKIWAFLDMGIAAGDDPLFAFFKEDIGDFYWTPAEAYRQVYPNAEVTDKELSVLSFGFFMDEKIKAEQKQQKKAPCMRWMYSRNNWKPFIDDFARRFIDQLAKRGIEAASLEFASDFGYDIHSHKYGRSASWSYRHAAYVAGQGTFGLSENFISRYGVAARYTTVIVRANFKPDERLYSGPYDWCGFYANGSCNACIKRCPPNAILEDSHHKTNCHDYAQKMSDNVADEPVLKPVTALWCGLCQTKVPCQDGIPKDILKNMK